MEMTGRSSRDWRELGNKGLFVIGHARTGTTVLQNALNDSKNILLFGEANFYVDKGQPDFRARFNKWHDLNGNQPTKSTYCPAVFDGDGTWEDYWVHFSHFYRCVGEKIIFNPTETSAQCDALMGFFAAHFFTGQFIFCFRNPIDVLFSVRKLAEYHGTPMTDVSIMISYLSVLRLYLTMVRLFPNVHVVFHEEPSKECFDAIGQSLDVGLNHVMSYYQTERVSRHSIDEIPAGCRDRVKELDSLYNHLRDRARGGFVLPQLEQNRYNYSPTHPTPLGGLYNATEMLLRDLAVS